VVPARSLSVSDIASHANAVGGKCLCQHEGRARGDPRDPIFANCGTRLKSVGVSLRMAARSVRIRSPARAFRQRLGSRPLTSPPQQASERATARLVRRSSRLPQHLQRGAPDADALQNVAFCGLQTKRFT
jgi:hypothetical protein